MGWLLGPVIASIVSAFVVVRIFDYIFGGVTSGVINPIRSILFVGTSTAVTTGSGMRGFTSRVRRLRRGVTAAENRLHSLTESEHRSRRQT